MFLFMKIKIISIEEISRNSRKDQSKVHPKSYHLEITILLTVTAHVKMCSTVFDLREVQVLGVSHCFQGLESVNNATERMSY